MSIDRVLIFDVETSGTDPAKDSIIEAAGILWSTMHVSTIAGFSFIVRRSDNAAQPINGIPPALLEEHGLPPADAYGRIDAWMRRADIIVAHNAAFDRGFCTVAFADPGRPWVCSQDDIDWPRPSPSQKLTDIMLAHGLGVSHAHRALVDVMNIARLLERAEELQGYEGGTRRLLERAMRPKQRYRAVTGKYDAKMNEVYKQHGFRWDGDHKEWWRKLAIEDVPAMQTKYPFAIIASAVSGG